MPTSGSITDGSFPSTDRSIDGAKIYAVSTKCERGGVRCGYVSFALAAWRGEKN